MNKQYLVDGKITNDYVESYIKSNYRIIGENKHTAIKPCHWLEQRLMTGRNNRNCYKGAFGIESHRCLQNTPSLPFCNHQCIFCWRDIEEGSLGSQFEVTPDEPSDLVDEMIRHQKDLIRNHLPLKRYLNNYEIMIDTLHYMLLHNDNFSVNSLSNSISVSKNKISRAVNLLKNQEFIFPIDESYKFYKLDPEIENSLDSREEIELLINRALTNPDDIMKAHTEALYPNHAAISLDGEPMLYPKISGLVQEFKKRDMTTFIVTNGTMPEKLEDLETLPSQLYITLPAPNKKLYKKICRPMIKKGWEKLMNSLELIESLNTRVVLRLTALKNLNINENYIEDYIKIIEKVNPHFFEIKGFTLQAKALLIKERLKENEPVQSYFPEYEYLAGIANIIEKKSEFPLIYTNKASRDFLFAVNWNENADPKITSP